MNAMLKKIKEENELESGSIVRLKSGGPLMTVLSMTFKYYSRKPKRAVDTYLCMWFNKNNSMEAEDFPWYALYEVSPHV